MTTTKQTRVLVAGAGIGGIAVAELLSRGPNVHVTLYERDAGRNTRDQGLVIGLRQEAFDILTKQLGWSNIESLFSPHGAKDLALVSASSSKPLIHAHNVLSIQNAAGGKLSSLVSRSDLRNAMMDSLSEAVDVQYSKQVVSYVEENDTVKVTCADGSVAEFNVLVGADGARSRVRQVRCPELTPVELGYWTDAASFLLSPEQNNALVENPLFHFAKTSLVRKAGQLGASLLCFVHHHEQRGAQLLWSVSMPQSLADEAQLHSVLPKDEMLQKTIDLAKRAFTADVVSLLQQTPADAMFPGYKFYSVLPDVVSSNPLGGQASSVVTLIGDAAHKTTTQAGLGATAALQDAVLLASKFDMFLNEKPVPEILRLYEVEMVRAAKSVVGQSVANTRRIHNTNPWTIAIANGFMRCVGWLIKLYEWWHTPRKESKLRQE